MSVLHEIESYLEEAEVEAHEALQVGGYIPLDDDCEAPGITYGELRRWREDLLPEPRRRLVPRWLRGILCALSDHSYDWADTLPEPTCERCGCATYYPVRRTVGRLLEDLASRVRQRWQGRDDDIPF